ncbi:site-specific integrase [Lactococcus garvieae]|uniref:tyrosine-type recombinase/integrase n=1 Tax=Lactococcus garvieae TaxID=1363 RepID=UPI00324EDC52
MANGKYRFREKYQDKDGIWREVSVTMTSKSREAQREAFNTIERRIQEKLQKCEKIMALTQEMTVNDVLAQSTKKRKMELAPSSFYQENCFLNVFLKSFGTKKIKDVKARDLQDYIVTNSKSIKTMHALKRGINSIFKYAYIAEYIDSNPINRFDLPKDTRTKESVAKLKQKFFTLNEFNTLIKQMRHNANSDETHRKIDLLDFLFWTGLRIGEALALKWSDVDLLNGKISITKSWDTKRHLLGNVKTIDSIREIDINVHCLEIVQNFKKYNSEFIFVTEKGKQIHYISLSQFLKYEVAKAHLFGKNPDYFSLHMLRHSHVTYLVNMGVYTHILPEKCATLFQALDYITSWGQNFDEQKIPKKFPKIIEHREA